MNPLATLALLALLLPGAARAGEVTIRNGAAEAITGIRFGGGESRLRRDLPPGAEARIGYSTGCQADIRIVYGSGRTEDHPGVDTCSGSRVVAGQDGTAGPAVAPQPRTAEARPGDPKAAKVANTVPATPVKAPPPVVPPWTGKSITKRFGGLD